MKVRYKVDYTDEFGYYFPNGCVAEHDESSALARIALGVAEEAPKEAYSRKIPPAAPLQFECVPDTPPVEAKQKTNTTKNTNTWHKQ